MQIERINWDSDFFNFEIGLIVNDSGSNSSAQSYSLLISNAEYPIIPTGFEKKFSEIKLIFNKKTNGLFQKNKIKNLVVDSDLVKLETGQIYDLAYESGKYSRFLLDKNFGEDNFKSLYRIWVDNSIKKRISDKIFLAFEGERIVGFITLKISGNIGEIGLLGVASSYQGSGIGSDLVHTVENYCLQIGVTEVNIPTQLINQDAVQFYHKLGYSILKRINITHFWRNDTI